MTVYNKNINIVISIELHTQCHLKVFRKEWNNGKNSESHMMIWLLKSWIWGHQKWPLTSMAFTWNIGVANLFCRSVAFWLKIGTSPSTPVVIHSRICSIFSLITIIKASHILWAASTAYCTIIYSLSSHLVLYYLKRKHPIKSEYSVYV